MQRSPDARLELAKERLRARSSTAASLYLRLPRGSALWGMTIRILARARSRYRPGGNSHIIRVGRKARARSRDAWRRRR